jgi:hypothetical protein
MSIVSFVVQERGNETRNLDCCCVVAFTFRWRHAACFAAVFIAVSLMLIIRRGMMGWDQKLMGWDVIERRPATRSFLASCGHIRSADATVLSRKKLIPNERRHAIFEF